MKKINEFLPIEGFDGYYVNSQGIIVSTNVGTIIRELRPQMHNSGYYTLKIINNDGKLEHKFIHRLVAKTFIDNPENLSDANHKDLNKTNNYANNLEWVSRSDNLKHFYNMSNKTSATECELYDKNELIGTFKSIRKACIYVNENIESVNINSMGNQIRIGIKPYKGKYSIKRL